MKSEILIVGGGVIGLSIARELHKRGIREISVVEKGQIGREASFAAAGMLAPNAEAEKADDFFDFCSESNKLYLAFAAELLDETAVDIELERSGTLYISMSEVESQALEKRLRWQTDAGISVEYLSARETLAAEPHISESVFDSLFFADDNQVENRKLLLALKTYAEKNGIKIYGNQTVSKIIKKGDTAIGVVTNDNNFFAGTTILATGAWTSFIEAIPFDIRPIRGQMLSFRPPAKLFQHVIYGANGYLVPRRDGRILVGATVEDKGFDKSISAAETSNLRQTACTIAPQLAGLDIADQWVGLRPFANGGLPVLGKVPLFDSLFIATAHYRNGILLAPLTAKIMTERIIDGTANKYLAAFGTEKVWN